MLFGMPTLIETETLTDCVQLCKALGLDFIELNMNLPAYQADVLDIEQLNRIHNTQNIFFTIHLDENLNVCDFNRLVASAYLETVLQTIEAAKRIGAPVLNMHMAGGVYFTLPDRREYLFARYRDNYLSALSRFRQACAHAIGTSGIKITIENTNGYPDFIKEGIELLLESNTFALTLDTGHSRCAGGIDEAFILSHSDRLRICICMTRPVKKITYRLGQAICRCKRIFHSQKSTAAVSYWKQKQSAACVKALVY